MGCVMYAQHMEGCGPWGHLVVNVSRRATYLKKLGNNFVATYIKKVKGKREDFEGCE